MDEFFKYDLHSSGSKGLVFIGNDVLVYRRDTNTVNHPLEIDLPGGGPEGNETPFETFRREVKEEFNLAITSKDIQYVRKYPSSGSPGKYDYYPVAKLPAGFAKSISLGDEGIEYMLMSFEEYIVRTDAWPIFQHRAIDYKNTFKLT